MKESSIEKSVCNYAKSKNILVFKMTQEIGIPDRLFIYQDRCFFIEFKSANGVLTEIQKYKISTLQNKNVPVYIINNVDEGKKLIDNFLERYKDV